MFLLCHPWFTTTNLSYTFPIFETSATASCGSTCMLSVVYCANATKCYIWSKVPCHILLAVVEAARVIGKGGASIKVGVWHWINLVVLGRDQRFQRSCNNESRMSLVSSWRRCSSHIDIRYTYHPTHIIYYKEKIDILQHIYIYILWLDPQLKMKKHNKLHGKKQNIPDFSDTLLHGSEQLSPCNGWRMLTVIILCCIWGHSWTERDS